MKKILPSQNCWICQGDVELAKPSDLTNSLRSDDFAITDSDYGATGEIHRCLNCGFLQCSEMREVLQYYQNLEDETYEATREPRRLQAERLIKSIQTYKKTGRLLDVGAGSGILVEQANAMGFDAEGIEPSTWLANRAAERGLKVYNGVLPMGSLENRYDLLTLVDVIEHVPDPVDLLKNCRDVMKENAVGMLITPDVGSIMSRFMGWKWWHFRVAHIGYFKKSNLLNALSLANLEPLVLSRPSWYFTLEYLIERVNVYLPFGLNFRAPKWTKKITIPLNLRDSWLLIFIKKNDTK